MKIIFWRPTGRDFRRRCPQTVFGGEWTCSKGHQ
jgi:hypothetical protein